MTVVVAYKYASNPQDATVSKDGNVDWSRAKSAISEYDPVAVQLARIVADAQGTEVVGVSVGTSEIASSKAKKASLSRGMDKAIVVADDAAKDWNPTKVASGLSQLVNKVGDADLVVTGDSSIDDGARMMSGLIAGYLGWPCFQEVSSIEKTNAGYKLTQTVAQGTREIEVNGPVVVSATSDAVETKVPSMKDVLAAGKKELDSVPESDLDWSSATLEVVSSSKPAEQSRKHEVFSGADAPEKLIEVLRADSII